MTTDAFRPTLYVKTGCPNCLKVRLFLLEAGLIDRLDLREFTAGDDREAPIKAELAPHFAKVTFPTVRTGPDHYMNESDDIITHYAGAFGVDTGKLALLRDYADVLLPRYKARGEEIKALREKLLETIDPS